MGNGDTTVEDYLAGLDADRRAAIGTVRDVVNQHLPAGFEEQFDFGMITWGIPLRRYPGTYNGHPLGIAALASQKRHMALYLSGVQTSADDVTWFREQYAKRGLRLDMGKSCVRFRALDQLPLDVVGEAVARISPELLITRYEATRATTGAEA
jgi:hypothetical protein